MQFGFFGMMLYWVMFVLQLMQKMENWGLGGCVLKFKMICVGDFFGCEFFSIVLDVVEEFDMMELQEFMFEMCEIYFYVQKMQFFDVCKFKVGFLFFMIVLDEELMCIQIGILLKVKWVICEYFMRYGLQC